MFMPHALESSHVIDPLEGGTPLVLPKSFFFLIFQLENVYFHLFLLWNFPPLTLHPSITSDTNRQHLLPSPQEVFLWQVWKHPPLPFGMATFLLLSSPNSLHLMLPIPLPRFVPFLIYYLVIA
jgi:hypothetical protein